MQLKRRERKKTRNWISCKKWFLAQKSKSKKIHDTHWDGYHRYQDRIKELEGRGLVEREERSLEEFIL
jgi:hypothetical protein